MATVIQLNYNACILAVNNNNTNTNNNNNNNNNNNTD